MWTRRRWAIVLRLRLRVGQGRRTRTRTRTRAHLVTGAADDARPFAADGPVRRGARVERPGAHPVPAGAWAAPTTAADDGAAPFGDAEPVPVGRARGGRHEPVHAAGRSAAAGRDRDRHRPGLLARWRHAEAGAARGAAAAVLVPGAAARPAAAALPRGDAFV